ncbi:hypothetical protein MMC25_005744 [Agyrium rufum]|nr:hypothetical protein [Agyrium rufum]
MIVQRQLRGGEHASSGPFGPDLIASPARSVVRYEAVEFDNLLLGTSPFRGPMRPEQDEAWDILLEDQNIIVQEEDLIKVNRTSLKMYDGSGYLAALDVYHELHCLNYIRKYIHRDYYANDELPETQIVHVGHCIDTLRMTLMCHADISLVTYDWLPNLSAPWPNFNNEHECRNWDSIEKYAKEHTIGANNPTGPWMKNPYTGKFWPEPEKGAGSG